MPELLKCPHGHEWEASPPAAGESQRDVPCPVCGAVVATRPSYLRDTLPSTDSLANSPARDDGTLSSRPTKIMNAPQRADAPLSSSELEFPQIQGYTIFRELGRGGMGVVYLASQDDLDRFVALKMIIPRDDATADDMTRFKQEATALSRVQHPNLVNVFAFGVHEQRAFIALEFVEGGNLDDKYNGKPQPPLEAAKMAETLARAMHAAHMKDVVHRDLKPANVLLTTDGTPKITDFGLVRRKDVHGPTNRPLTDTGIIMGTPYYMAPEQASGSNELIGPKTDVYALGAMLYEFLTGRPPFMADDGWDTILQVVSDPPVPPSHLNHKIPIDLETICLKCLEKDPKDRYESALALAEDLARFQSSQPILARTVGPHERLWKWAKRRPAAAGLIATAAVAVLALLRLGWAHHQHIRLDAEEARQRVVHLSVSNGVHHLDADDWYGGLLWFVEALKKDPANSAREAVHRQRIAAVLGHSPQLVRTWFHNGPVRCVAFSHNGRQLVTASADRTAQVWDLETGNPSGHAMEHQGIVFQAWFSPDDQTVLTAGDDGFARLWNAATGSPRGARLQHGKTVNYASFSPNGRRILTSGGTNEAILWDSWSGKSIDPPLKHERRVVYACFSPDGRWLATTSEDGTASVWNADTGKRAANVRHDGPVTFAAFQPRPKGDMMVTTSTDRTARAWKVPSGEPLYSQPLQHSETVNSAVFNQDGSQFVTTSNDDTVKLWDARTGRLAAPPLQHGSDVRRYAAFSPDGRWVATGSDDNTARVWSTLTGEPIMTRLVHNGTVYCTALSPDGSLLATVSDDNSVRVWSLLGLRSKASTPAASAAPVEIPLDVAAPPLPPLHDLRIEGTRVAGKNPATGAQVHLDLKPTDAGESEPSRLDYVVFNADGSLLASIQGGRQAVRVWDAKTGAALTPPLRHTGILTNVRFSGTGKLLVTCSSDNTARVWDVSTGALVAPPLRHRGTVTDADFSPDGTMVVTASKDRTARVWEVHTGEPITPALAHPHSVESAAFSADGKTITTRAADGSTRRRELTQETRSLPELEQLAQVLAGRRIADGACWPLEAQEYRETWKALQSQFPGAVGTWKRAP